MKGYLFIYLFGQYIRFEAKFETGNSTYSKSLRFSKTVAEELILRLERTCFLVSLFFCSIEPDDGVIHPLWIHHPPTFVPCPATTSLAFRWMLRCEVCVYVCVCAWVGGWVGVTRRMIRSGGPHLSCRVNPQLIQSRGLGDSLGGATVWGGGVAEAPASD